MKIIHFTGKISAYAAFPDKAEIGWETAQAYLRHDMAMYDVDWQEADPANIHDLWVNEKPLGPAAEGKATVGELLVPPIGIHGHGPLPQFGCPSCIQMVRDSTGKEV